jgi:hypothetical protein
MMLGACGGTSGVRRPSRSERAEIVAAINQLWSGWARDPFQPCCVSGRLRAELARRFPGVARGHDYSRVISIRVSERDPRLAVAAVEVFNASGQPTHQATVMMLDKRRPLEHGEPGWVANTGPVSCLPLLTGAVRELFCPSPWSVLHYGAGEAQAKAASVGTIGPRWSEVALPGSVCGTTTPIHLHWTGKFGRAFVRSTYWPWLPAVVVSAGQPHLRESLGNGEPELGDKLTSYGYMNVECNTGGGMGPDKLANSVVVFVTGEHQEGEPGYPLRFIGVITPQQPYTEGSAEGSPPYIGGVELTRNIASASTRPGHLTFRGLVIVREAWHGPADSPDFPTGRATTIWTYSHGKLVSPRTVVDLAPQTSRP